MERESSGSSSRSAGPIRLPIMPSLQPRSLFQPQRASKTFVSMVSSHVTRGRRNLAANTIFLMRHIGMSAFQTTLLPSLPPEEIRRINQLEKHLIAGLNLDTRQEIARAMIVSEALAMTGRYRVFFVGDLLEVMCNLQYWNRSVLTDDGRKLWGCRRASYFVFDPETKLFAPSKFCAFRPITADGADAAQIPAPNMTMDLYCSLGEEDPRFDGSRAWRHLRDHLGMSLEVIADAPALSAHFQKWLQEMGHAVETGGKPTMALCPPTWFG